MRRKHFILPLLGLVVVAALAMGMRCIVGTATVVIDADTIEITANLPLNWGDDCPVEPGQTYRVHLIGVDTPECFSQAALDYLRNMVENHNVCLLRDVSCKDQDGNLLAYVWVDTDPTQSGCDTFLNGELIKQGYAQAVASPTDTSFNEIFEALQCDAAANGRGMWASCGLAAPANCVVPQPTPQPTPTPLTFPYPQRTPT
jgi:endonuclease YncB( thermonuclease family)